MGKGARGRGAQGGRGTGEAPSSTGGPFLVCRALPRPPRSLRGTARAPQPSRGGDRTPKPSGSDDRVPTASKQWRPGKGLSLHSQGVSWGQRGWAATFQPWKQPELRGASGRQRSVEEGKSSAGVQHPAPAPALPVVCSCATAPWPLPSPAPPGHGCPWPGSCCCRETPAPRTHGVVGQTSWQPQGHPGTQQTLPPTHVQAGASLARRRGRRRLTQVELRGRGGTEALAPPPHAGRPLAGNRCQQPRRPPQGQRR